MPQTNTKGHLRNKLINMSPCWQMLSYIGPHQKDKLGVAEFLL